MSSDRGGDGPKRHYDRGYCKPPPEHRFKPGNQAARGRKRKPAGTMSLSEAMGTVLKRRVRVKRGDKYVTMAAAEILSERLLQGITRGPMRDLIAIVNLFKQHAPDELAAAVPVFRVEYCRAEGSTVELPPLDLYDAEPSS